MTSSTPNKYRAALEILQRGRDRLVEELADQVLDQADDFLDSGFLFNEFLENQGTRLHFLSLLVAQLEQSAEQLDEPQNMSAQPIPEHIEYADFEEEEPPSSPKQRKRRNRSKKLTNQRARESEPGEA